MRRIPLLFAALLAAVPAFSAGSNSGRSGRGKTSNPVVTGVPTLNTNLNPGLVAPTLSAPALNLGLNPTVNVTGGKALTSESNNPSGNAKTSIVSQTPAPPYFVSSLQKAGVQAETALALDLYHADRHPGEQDKVYHGRGHSQDVATLMAKVAEGQGLASKQRALLVLAAALHDIDPERKAGTPARVSATVEYLSKDPATIRLLAAFQREHGFTTQQVAALIKFTDFNPDPAKLAALKEEAVKATEAAFSGEELEWALLWGPRLAFVDKVASYVGSVAAAELQVKNLAYEIRQGIEAATGRPSANPTDEAIRKGSYDFISQLLASEDVNLLPAKEAGNLALVAWHFKEVKETGKAAPKQRENLKLDEGIVDKAAAEGRKLGAGVDVSADVDAARRYVRSIMGARQPTQREVDTLLLDFMEMRRIEPGSARGKALRKEMLPDLVQSEESKLKGLSPKLASYGPLILRISEEKGIPVAELEAFIKEQGVAGPSTTEEMMDRVLRNYAERRELDAAVAGYPDTQQGQLMRDVAVTMLARSGKSVEEIARDGVFLYVDYAGAQVQRATVGRDPDPKTPHMIFYVTRDENKWKIAGYRNNRTLGRSDATLISDLIKWLGRGGVPASDFRN
jgi:hypothetical protein